MAFPQVASRTNTAFPTAATTHSANYPAIVDAGDLLLLLCGFKADPTITTPDGFTSITGGQAAGSAAGNKSGLYGRVADGTEGGGTVSITINQSRRGSAQIIRVTGWYGALAGVEAAFVNTSATTTPKPPSLSPSWGSAQNLFIVGLCTSDDDEYPTAAPTNYTDISYIQAGGGADVSVTTATALRELEAASDDPGTFTLNESGNSGAYTIAVRPAAGGSPYTLAMDGGTATMVGQSLGLTAARVLTMSGGTAAMAGQTVGLTVGRYLSLAGGTATMVGQAVNLVYTPDSGATYTLVMSGGSAVMQGQAAGLIAARTLSLGGAVLTMQGQSIGLARGYTLVLDGGAAAMQGQSLDFSYSRRLIMDNATLSMVGQPVGLIRLGDEIVGTLSLSAFYQTSIELTAIYDVVFDSNGSIQ